VASGAGLMDLLTNKAGAKHELLSNKPASEANVIKLKGALH